MDPARSRPRHGAADLRRPAGARRSTEAAAPVDADRPGRVRALPAPARKLAGAADAPARLQPRGAFAAPRAGHRGAREPGGRRAPVYVQRAPSHRGVAAGRAGAAGGISTACPPSPGPGAPLTSQSPLRPTVRDAYGAVFATY